MWCMDADAIDPVGFGSVAELARPVVTRYDKLAANYLAFVKLACIRLWLRVYEPRASGKN